jgi:hypothetical protein
MPNLFREASPPNYYCGDACYTYMDLPGGECSIGSGKQCPSGYTETENSAKCGECGAGTARCCDVDKYSPHWDPLTNEYLKDKTKVSNINKVYKCCAGETIGIDGKMECGSLWDGTKDGEPTCDNILKDYCNANPDKLTTVGGPCYNFAKVNPDQINLPEICSKENRANKNEWSEMCACYKPHSFYVDINKAINEKWGVPLNHMNFQPECIYPTCKVSPFKRAAYSNSSSKCPNPNFTHCISEIHLDLQGSKINKLQVEQLPQCMNKFTTNSNPPLGGNSNTGNSNTGNSNTGSGGSDGDSDDDGKTMKIILVVVAFFILIIGVAVVLMQSDDEESEKSGGFYSEFIDVNSY